MKQGLIHLYCGDGKGKTTAAVGLAVRAAGCGMQVLFARFLKNEHSGEIRILEGIPEIEVLHPEKSFGFFYTLSEEEKQEAKAVYGRLWEEIVRKAGEGCDMLVLDEFAAAYELNLLPRGAALRFLEERGETEVVLTGRNPAPEIAALADYVSEIRKEKHPFDRGIPARRGIEF